MVPQWQWAAQGKHPVAGDYISLGKEFPLIKVFSDWIDKGYQMVISKRIPSSHLYSWRFWTKGAVKDSFVCGLVKDSSDKLGRPYPLLFMGTGRLQGWKDKWDLLSLACERTWNSMENLLAKNERNVKHMEDEIHKVPPPLSRWTEFFKEKEHLLESSVEPRELVKGASGFSEKAEFFICLTQGLHYDHFTLVNLGHFYLKSCLNDKPNIVFIGGIADKVCLAGYKRPLAPADFVRLWSSHS